MKTIPLSRGLVALVDDEDYDAVIRMGSWCATPSARTFYALRNARRPDGGPTTLRMHRFLTGWQMVDHINGDGLDNRRSNLREATSAQNNANAQMNYNNTAGYKGVSRVKRSPNWRACIRISGKTRHLGMFPTAEDAARAYDAAARIVHGEFARLNFLADIQSAPTRTDSRRR